MISPCAPTDLPPPPLAAATLDLRLFGRPLRLHCSRPATRRHFSRLYLPEASPRALACLDAVEAPAPAHALSLGDAAWRWQGSGPLWPQVMETLLLQRLLTLHPELTVFHGAALGHARGDLCLLGPSGAGKSTLAAALASRPGLTLFSDELVCLTSPGRLRAFPRRLQLRPAARRLLREASALPPDRPAAAPDLSPRRIRFVFLLDSEETPAEDSLVVSGDAAVAQALAADLGVISRPHPHGWELVCPEGRSAGPLAQACWQSGLFVLGSPRPPAPWAFPSAPRLTPVPSWPGLSAALRHLRSPRLGPSPQAVFSRAAEVLGRAAFLRLRPGPPAETADLICSLLNAAPLPEACADA